MKTHIPAIPVKAGDPRVLINGYPSRVDFRLIAEDEYQLLLWTIQNIVNTQNDSTASLAKLNQVIRDAGTIIQKATQ